MGMYDYCTIFLFKSRIIISQTLASIAKVLRACSKDYIIINSTVIIPTLTLVMNTFQSLLQASVGEAAAICERHNSSLLAVEAMDEMRCLAGLAAGMETRHHQKLNVNRSLCHWPRFHCHRRKLLDIRLQRRRKLRRPGEVRVVLERGSTHP